MNETTTDICPFCGTEVTVIPAVIDPPEEPVKFDTHLCMACGTFYKDNPEENQ